MLLMRDKDGITEKYKSVVFLFLLVFSTVLQGYAQDKQIFLREDFNSLDNWRPVYFPKIKKHSKYSIESGANGSYLKAESHSSASGIVFKKEFNVYEYPKVRWRWKISNIYKKGNALKKSGDDYPARVYITFKCDPQKASFRQKIKFGLAKKIFGKYPPHSSLNYIWANRKHNERVLTSTYADESKMVILQAGGELAGVWKEQEINIVDDYREIFGTDPPATASLAIMNDSDNTGESSVSHFDYMEIYR